MSATPLALTPEALEAWDKALERAPSDGGACVLLKRTEVAALIHDAHVARELHDLVNTPELVDFAKGVHLEAVHQEQRWGTADRRGKQPYEWFWLLSHLATRALEHHKEAERLVTSKADYEDEEGSAFWALVDRQIAHHREKAAHHTITAAAVLAHWHAGVIGKHTAMQPGHSASVALAAELLGEGG
jgi:hypothetical protein